MEYFTNEVIEQLNYYVFRLVDPRNGQTFYVGKGKGNRIFAHVNCELDSYYDINYLDKNEEQENLKYQTIRDITNANLSVINIIHR